MAQRVVNIGTSVNKGDGDPLRTAFDKINDNFTELYADLQNANQTVNIKGSLFADDSTLLVDGVNGTIQASALSGAMPAIDGSALTGITVASVDFSNVTNLPTTLAGHGITDIIVQFSELANTPQTLQGYGIIDAVQSGGDFEGNLTGSVFADDSTLIIDGITGKITLRGSKEAFDTLTGSTGTVTHDCDNGHIFYHTGAAADWTANFTNLELTAEHATTLSIVIDQGATAYIPSAVQIGGVAQTLLWQGGSAPSGTADGTDVVAFSILNDGGTYVVMGQLVGFS